MTLKELRSRASQKWNRENAKRWRKLPESQRLRQLVIYARHQVYCYDVRLRAAVTEVEKRTVIVETFASIAAQWPEFADACRNKLRQRMKSWDKDEAWRARMMARCAKDVPALVDVA